MENQLDRSRLAHSGSRSGLDDYNDGSSYSHYMGNDEFYSFERMMQSTAKPDESTGQVAFGNELETDGELAETARKDPENSDQGKLHSGL